MANMHFITLVSSLILILHFSSPSVSASKETICQDTPYPNFCKSILPSNQSATIHDHSRISLQQSISTTKIFLSLINNYLKSPVKLPAYTIRVLEDCQILENMNIDFLSDILQSIRSTNSLQNSKADDFQSFLSATLTNHQTCLDGLESITSPLTLKSALKSQFSNGTMLNSVALAIFKHGWFPNKAKGRSLGENKWRFSVSEYNRKRKLYTIGANVKVNKTVVVNPNGSGNFNTISAAVAAAPNKTDGSKGYFVIHVVAGVYNEYVNIDKNKMYIMMIGDGINKTIITGNHNVDDGWTTFNSATFSKLLLVTFE